MTLLRCWDLGRHWRFSNYCIKPSKDLPSLFDWSSNLNVSFPHKSYQKLRLGKNWNWLCHSSSLRLSWNFFQKSPPLLARRPSSTSTKTKKSRLSLGFPALGPSERGADRGQLRNEWRATQRAKAVSLWQRVIILNPKK